MAASPSEDTSLAPETPEQTHPYYICLVECKEQDCKHQFCLKLHQTDNLKGMPEGVEVICSGAYKTLEKAKHQYDKMKDWKHVSMAAFKRQMLQENNAGAIFRSVLGEFFYTVYTNPNGATSYISKYYSQKQALAETPAPKQKDDKKKSKKRSERKEKKSSRSKKARK
jgi:hypothetical protein